MLTWQNVDVAGKFVAESNGLRFRIHSYDSLPYNTRIVWVLQVYRQNGLNTEQRYKSLATCKAQATRIAKRGL